MLNVTTRLQEFNTWVGQPCWVDIIFLKINLRQHFIYSVSDLKLNFFFLCFGNEKISISDFVQIILRQHFCVFETVFSILDFNFFVVNVCNNVLFTLWNETSKSKDHSKTRKDLREMGIRLDLWHNESGRYLWLCLKWQM